jgi:thiaminase/transcriptional activator TenA
MCQDYVFLIDYCRVLALAVAKADDIETMGRFAALLHTTLHTEMALHRDFAAQFGISVAELEATQAAPSTRSYTQHLLTVAYTGSLTDITAALLPCMWDYSEIGQRLAAKGLPAAQPLYGAWIRTYAAPEFGI